MINDACAHAMSMPNACLTPRVLHSAPSLLPLRSNSSGHGHDEVRCFPLNEPSFLHRAIAPMRVEGSQRREVSSATWRGCRTVVLGRSPTTPMRLAAQATADPPSSAGTEARRVLILLSFLGKGKDPHDLGHRGPSVLSMEEPAAQGATGPLRR